MGKAHGHRLQRERRQTVLVLVLVSLKMACYGREVDRVHMFESNNERIRTARPRTASVGVTPTITSYGV